jgi:hypothetical protein
MAAVAAMATAVKSAEPAGIEAASVAMSSVPMTMPVRRRPGAVGSVTAVDHVVAAGRADGRARSAMIA